MQHRVFLAVLLAVCAVAHRGMAQEERPWTPVMLSLATPLQAPSAEYEVKGVKLDILYGACSGVDGLSIGLVSRAKGAADGLQAAALVALVSGDGMGLQIAPVACVTGRYAGVQIGIANFARQAKCLQAGVYNGAEHIEGCQLGLINTAQTMYGVQLGLVNVIRDHDVPFLPFFNCYF